MNEVARRLGDIPGRKLLLLSLLARNGFGSDEAADILGDRFKLLADTIPQLVWRSRDLGRWTWASRQWAAFTGQGTDEASGLGWLAHVHPDDRAATMKEWEAAGERGSLEIVHRIVDTRDRYRWFETRAARVVAPGGEHDWFGTCTDVHDLRTSIDRERALRRELCHRVRNNLAIVRAMVRRGRDATGQASLLAGRLEGRIDAMARVQSRAVDDPFARVDLEWLVAGELRPTLAREGGGLAIAGPAASMTLPVAECLVAALHELAANAVEHGALAVPGGNLNVTWARVDAEGGPWLRIVWDESGAGPSIPMHEGYGMDVLKRRLPYDLDARVEMTFRPGGLLCRIDLPADHAPGTGSLSFDP